METLYLQPNEIKITVTPDETTLTAQPSQVAVTASPNTLNVTAEPQTVELTSQPNEVLLNVLSGANVTNNYGSDTVAVTAATNLSGNRIVTVEGNYADKDTTTDKFKVLGMTTGAATTGSEATVQVSGYITEAGWNFTVGSPVFLSTNGHITQTAPTSGFRMIVGRPKTATTLFLDFSEPIITV